MSSRETAFSGGAFSTLGLLSTQAAALEERVKQMELEDRCRIPGIGRNTRLIRNANYCLIGSGRNSGFRPVTTRGGVKGGTATPEGGTQGATAGP